MTDKADKEKNINNANWEEQGYEDPLFKLNHMIEESIDYFYNNHTKDMDAAYIVINEIISAMLNHTQVMIPIEMPEAAFKIFDPDKIKEGDIVTTDEELHIKILNLTDPEGNICMPVFTSQKKMDENTDGGLSTITFLLDDYIKQVMEMDDVEGLLINPGERSFFLKKHILKGIIGCYEDMRNNFHPADPNLN